MCVRFVLGFGLCGALGLIVFRRSAPAGSNAARTATEIHCAAWKTVEIDEMKESVCVCGVCVSQSNNLLYGLA